MAFWILKALLAPQGQSEVKKSKDAHKTLEKFHTVRYYLNSVVRALVIQLLHKGILFLVDHHTQFFFWWLNLYSINEFLFSSAPFTQSRLSFIQDKVI